MESLIARVNQRYHPEWEPPEDTGQEWISTRCPFHGDGIASAGISYRYNAFRCLGCGVGGSAVWILKEREEVSYAEAKRLAKEVSPGIDSAVQPEPARKPSRRVFGEQGPGGSEDSEVVPTGIRGRATPWS